MMLYKLLSRLDRGRFEAEVVSLTGLGPLGERIRDLGIPVRALGMRRGRPDAAALVRLSRLIRHGRFQIVQTWMYHADLIGGLASRLGSRAAVVWNIRHSNLDPSGDQRSTIWVARACARLSHAIPSAILCCSEAARRLHAAMGYASEKMVVIPNGFDLSSFRPDEEARRLVRLELGIDDGTPLVGLIGRFHQQKDHRTFLEAIRRVSAQVPDVHVVLCGRDVTWSNPDLAGSIEEAGLRDQCHLLGERADMPRITAALDIAVSASAYGDAFPNAVGEAMACGVPCVVTDVGDSGSLLGETGRVVPPREPAAMAEALGDLLAWDQGARRRLGLAARERIASRFELNRIVRSIEEMYARLAAGRTR